MFHSILDFHPDAICRFDTDLNFIYVNKAAIRMFRADQADLIGSHLIDRVPDDQKHDVRNRFRALTKDAPSSTNLHELTREQGLVYMLWSNMAVFEGGRLVGYQTAGRDVSAETRMRHEMREQAGQLERVQRELRLVLDAVPSRIWYKDDQNVILRLNKAAADSMGRTVANTEGANTYDLFGEAAKSYHDDDLAVINSGEALRGKIEPYTPEEGDPGWVQTDKIPLTLDGPDDRRILVVSNDITDLKEKEAMLEAINSNLDDFASLTSHDLQAPLRKIAISAELMELELGDALPDGAHVHLSEIAEGVTHMRSLIRSFLSFMRASPHDIELGPINLKTVLDDVSAREATALKAAGARVTLPDGPISVAGDPALLGQVFSNLIGNAIKYADPERPLEISISAQRELQNWTIRVVDNGRGIDSADKAAIFDLFGRSKPMANVEGSGIGLALCRRIINLHGGSIDLDEHDGPGAAFRIQLTARRQIE